MSANSDNPAGTHDFVYPGLVEDREVAAVQKARSDAREGNISSPTVRDILPAEDLNSGAESTWSEDENRWVQAPDTADGAAAESGTYEVYEIDSDTGRADDRTLAVYGFEIIEGGQYVDTILFRGSDGQVFERAKVEGLDETGDTQVDRQKVLRSPIGFGAQDNATIEFEVNDYTANDDTIRVKLLGVAAEKSGRTLGDRL
jgi:hypothetical protein